MTKAFRKSIGRHESELLIICPVPQCSVSKETGLDLVLHLMRYHHIEEAKVIELATAAMTEAEAYPFSLEKESAA